MVIGSGYRRYVIIAIEARKGVRRSDSRAFLAKVSVTTGLRGHCSVRRVRRQGTYGDWRWEPSGPEAKTLVLITVTGVGVGTSHAAQAGTPTTK